MAYLVNTEPVAGQIPGRFPALGPADVENWNWLSVTSLSAARVSGRSASWFVLVRSQRVVGNVSIKFIKISKSNTFIKPRYLATHSASWNSF